MTVTSFLETAVPAAVAETIALIWDGEPQGDLSIAEAVHLLETTGKAGLPAAIAGVLDRLGPSPVHRTRFENVSRTARVGAP